MTTTLVTQLQNAVTRRDASEQTIARLVDRCRSAGMSWTEIARYLGVTKQAAQQRYGR